MSVGKLARFLSAIKGLIGPLVAVPGVVTYLGSQSCERKGLQPRICTGITFALGNAGNPNVTDV